MTFIPTARRLAATLALGWYAWFPAIGQTTETIDALTRWTIRVESEATTESSIVRVGDVARLVGKPSSAWNRIASAPVALIPVSGKEVTIDRDRLATLVDNAEAVPASIGWIGPRTIRVRRVQSPPKPGSAMRSATAVEQVGHQQTVPAGGMPRLPPVVAPPARPLSQIDRDRIERLIVANVRRFRPDIESIYAFELVDTPELIPLSVVSSVISAEPTTEIAAGDIRFNVSMRSSRGAIDSYVTLRLTEHPRVVAAARSLPSGHRLSTSDLRWISIPEDRLPAAYVTEMSDLIGKETRSSLRSGAPIAPASVGRPILIRRGDLIEVRVVGGGVTVTTNAKSLDDGSESQLIEIETRSPRKRMVARVIDMGTVEVLTRSPVVR